MVHIIVEIAKQVVSSIYPVVPMQATAMHSICAQLQKVPARPEQVNDEITDETEDKRYSRNVS